MRKMQDRISSRSSLLIKCISKMELSAKNDYRPAKHARANKWSRYNTNRVPETVFQDYIYTVPNLNVWMTKTIAKVLSLFRNGIWKGNNMPPCLIFKMIYTYKTDLNIIFVYGNLFISMLSIIKRTWTSWKCFEHIHFNHNVDMISCWYFCW